MSKVDLLTEVNEEEKHKKTCELSDFKVMGSLGKGSFGVVKLAVHKSTKQSYALKIL